MGYVNRAPYLAIVEKSVEEYTAGKQTGHAILCGFCRYFEVWADPEGGYPDVECVHPLTRASQRPPYPRSPIPDEYAWEGGDCWGFRPSVKGRESRRQGAA